MAPVGHTSERAASCHPLDRRRTMSELAVRPAPLTEAARAFRGGVVVGQTRHTARVVDGGGTVAHRAPGGWTRSPGSQARGAFLRGG